MEILLEFVQIGILVAIVIILLIEAATRMFLDI